MKRLVLAALVLAMPLPALADVIGTYLITHGDRTQSMTLTYKDDQHIRMDTGQGNYLLITGDKVYAVANAQGKVQAVDLASMPKFLLPKGKAADEGNVAIRKTGRSETIAGIKGDVYEIVVDGETSEAVLSTDRRAAPLSKAFLAMAKRMGDVLGGDTADAIEAATREAQKYGYGALLRANRQMVLQAVADSPLPVSYYQLPPGVTPTEIPAFGGGQGGARPMPQMDPATMKKMQEAMQKMMQQQGR